MSAVRELLVSPGPHLWRETSINRVMYIVILTLLLPAGAAIYYFGTRAIFLILGCILA